MIRPATLIVVDRTNRRIAAVYNGLYAPEQLASAVYMHQAAMRLIQPLIPEGPSSFRLAWALGNVTLEEAKSIDIDDVLSRLAGIESTLSADGYTLRVSPSPQPETRN